MMRAHPVTLRSLTALLSAATLVSACSGARSAPGGTGILPAGFDRRGVLNSVQGLLEPNGIVQIPGAPKDARGIVSDGAGYEWFSECETTIARIDEVTHVFSQFNAARGSSCNGGVALGRNRSAIWFCDYINDKIGFIYLKSHDINVFLIPTKNAYPWDIAAGSDDAMWFTESSGSDHGKIGRIDLSSRPYQITDYSLPYNGGKGSPLYIALGSDGALWFTDPFVNGIGRITTSHHISLYVLPHGNSYPYGIASGPDGALWFTENTTGRIGRINPSTHAISEWNIPTLHSDPYEIVARGSDLWFTEFGVDKIGCIGSTNHQFHEYRLPQGSHPRGITLGSDNRLWFTEPGTNSLGNYLPPGPCGG